MSELGETEQCKNCKLDILTNNYLIHSIHCQRNFYLCSLCDQPVNYNNKVEHDEDNHITVKCKNCRLPLEKCFLQDHLQNNCPHRKVKCQFCSIEIEAKEISEHEDYCGSRTEKCSECGEFVMLKYKSLHVESNHNFIKLSDEPGPSPSWQHGKRTLSNFLPDLTSSNYKPLSSQKKRYGERRKSRSSNSRSDAEDKPDEKETSDINLFDDGTVGIPLSKYLESKAAERNNDLSSLLFTSLQISNDKKHKRDSLSDSKHSINPMLTDEESDFVYAIKVAQELNSHLLKPDTETKPENDLRFPLKTDIRKNSSGMTDLEKNLCSSTSKVKLEPKGKKLYHENGDDDCTLNANENHVNHDNTRVKLPCEFCGLLVPAETLIFHQSGCGFFVKDEEYRRKFVLPTQNRDIKMRCEECNKLLTLSNYESHQLSCSPKVTKCRKGKDKVNCLTTQGEFSKSQSSLSKSSMESPPHGSGTEGQPEWLSGLTKYSNDVEKDLKINLNQPDNKGLTKSTKLSRKNKRAPSPPKM